MAHCRIGLSIGLISDSVVRRRRYWKWCPNGPASSGESWGINWAIVEIKIESQSG
jgi:hypothetical protein